MIKYDVPVNFKVFDETEEKAIYKLQKFLHRAILEFDLDKEIVDHDLFEFIQSPPICEGCNL